MSDDEKYGEIKSRFYDGVLILDEAEVALMDDVYRSISDKEGFLRLMEVFAEAGVGLLESIDGG